MTCTRHKLSDHVISETNGKEKFGKLNKHFYHKNYYTVYGTFGLLQW